MGSLPKASPSASPVGSGGAAAGAGPRGGGATGSSSSITASGSRPGSVPASPADSGIESSLVTSPQLKSPPHQSVGNKQVFGADGPQVTPTMESPADSSGPDGVQAGTLPASAGISALRLQSMWRGFKARRKARDLAKQVYEKAVDPTYNAAYYFNSKTGESRWTKPMLLGSDDCETV